MKIAIIGGHFSPAYSLIQKLSGKADFVIIGRQHAFEGDTGETLEYRIAMQEGIPFYNLQTGRLQRKLTRSTIPSILKIPVGLNQSLNILRKENPDMVISFGGYLAVPVAIAAKVLSIPVIIHEQTQGAGLANKVVGKFADKVLISFQSSHKYFPKDKTVLTGNPVRREVFEVNEKIDIPDSKPLIYVTGGSAGSHMINEAIIEVIDKLVSNFTVIHQTGDSNLFTDYNDAITKRNHLPMPLQKRYIVEKFIFPNQIGSVMQTAELVIGRAGINTVCELMALKKMALLIPLAISGQRNEQLNNAKLIKKVGIGEYMHQETLSGDTLLGKITEMFDDKTKYEIKEIPPEYYTNDAILRIIEQVQKVYEEKKKK